VRLTVPVADGDPIEFECADTASSRWVSREILHGRTYPYLPFVADVKVVFDVGANCGATSVHLARHYPEAEIHAFEPGSEARGYLERNVAQFRNVRIHPVGLYSVDDSVPLYVGDGDIGMASIHARDVNLDQSELVRLRAAGGWATEHGIDRIDVLKVDVEGAEVEVLTSLAHLLPTVKILYVEYDSRHARRAIAQLVDSTHELYIGSEFLDQGEVVYLRKDLADDPAATQRLRELLAASLAPR
jgi:FkbM family methyltransferase